MFSTFLKHFRSKNIQFHILIPKRHLTDALGSILTMLQYLTL